MSRIGVNSSLQSDEAPIGFLMWEVMDSNHRRRTPADLQSAPFGHSGNFPSFVAHAVRDRAVDLPVPDQPPGRLLEIGIRADGGIRTHDQLITNQLLWPTELHRQIPPFWIAKVVIKNLPTKYFDDKFSTFSLFSKNGARSSGLQGRNRVQR